MNGKTILRQLRRLCRDIDEGEPLRPIRLRRLFVSAGVAPAAVVLSMGAAGCGAPRHEMPPEPAEARSEVVQPEPEPGAVGLDAPEPPPQTLPARDTAAAIPDGCPDEPLQPAEAVPSPSASMPGSVPPTIRVGEVTVLYGAGFERETVRRVVRRHNPRLRACYESRLDDRPDLAGRVTVRWTIDAGGEVSGASIVSSTLGDEEVERCVLCAVQRMRFPESRTGGSTIVTYPFDFAHGPDAPDAP